VYARVCVGGGATKNTGRENNGPSKSQGVKMQDMKMQDFKNAGHENRWHETLYCLLALKLPGANLQRCNMV